MLAMKLYRLGCDKGREDVGDRKWRFGRNLNVKLWDSFGVKNDEYVCKTVSLSQTAEDFEANVDCFEFLNHGAAKLI